VARLFTCSGEVHPSVANIVIFRKYEAQNHQVHIYNLCVCYSHLILQISSSSHLQQHLFHVRKILFKLAQQLYVRLF
jgi:hypothetical protein